MARASGEKSENPGEEGPAPRRHEEREGERAEGKSLLTSLFMLSCLRGSGPFSAVVWLKTEDPEGGVFGRGAGAGGLPPGVQARGEEAEAGDRPAADHDDEGDAAQFRPHLLHGVARRDARPLKLADTDAVIVDELPAEVAGQDDADDQHAADGAGA